MEIVCLTFIPVTTAQSVCNECIAKGKTNLGSENTHRRSNTKFLQKINYIFLWSRKQFT